jgi:hypothetical protein
MVNSLAIACSESEAHLEMATRNHNLLFRGTASVVSRLSPYADGGRTRTEYQTMESMLQWCDRGL